MTLLELMLGSPTPFPLPKIPSRKSLQENLWVKHSLFTHNSQTVLACFCFPSLSQCTCGAVLPEASMISDHGVAKSVPVTRPGAHTAYKCKN